MSDLRHTTYSGAYRPTELVGRSRQKQDIVEAVEGGRRVVYIEGQGGIGKTHLLTEAAAFIPELVRSKPKPIVLAIIDFYNTALHSSISLEQALIDRIRERPDGDSAVLDQFAELVEKYRAGHGSEAEVHEAFADAFNRWAGQRRVVLCFDTAEALEYGRDDQRDIDDRDIAGQKVSAVQWILQKLKKLSNATLLIAGRPTRTRYLYHQLGKAEEQPLLLSLDTLSHEETRAYFEASEYGQGEDEETIERVWLLSNGRPILISLAIDWLQRGSNWAISIGTIWTICAR